MPSVRAEDGADARDEPEDVLGQVASPSDGGGDSDAADIREALEKDRKGSGLSRHNSFMQVGDEKVRATKPLLFPIETKHTVAQSTCTISRSCFVAQTTGLKTKHKSNICL